MNNDPVQLSPIKLRLYSLLIDLLIVVPYTFLAITLIGECAKLAGDDYTRVLVYVCLAPFYFAGIFFIIIFPEGVWGQTLGKCAVGIKVVDQSDYKPGIIGSVIRHFLDPIDICFLVGYLIAKKIPASRGLVILWPIQMLCEKFQTNSLDLYYTTNL